MISAFCMRQTERKCKMPRIRRTTTTRINKIKLKLQLNYIFIHMYVRVQNVSKTL